MKAIIYLASNKENGKKYIGQTIRKLSARKNQHYKHSSPCTAFSRAIKKYGKESFVWEILYESEEDTLLNDVEEYFIKYYNTLAPNGYNLKSSVKGKRIISEETRLKMSIAQKGRIVSEDTKRKMSEAAKKVPSEIKRQNALGNSNRKGKKASANTKLKLSLSHKGNFHSEETKQKISLAKKEYWKNKS